VQEDIRGRGDGRQLRHLPEITESVEHDLFYLLGGVERPPRPAADRRRRVQLVGFLVPGKQGPLLPPRGSTAEDSGRLVISLGDIDYPPKLGATGKGNIFIGGSIAPGSFNWVVR